MTDQAAALNDQYQAETHTWAAQERRAAKAEREQRRPKPTKRPTPQPRGSTVRITR